MQRVDFRKEIVIVRMIFMERRRYTVIRHTVAFRLKHLPGSDGEKSFLKDAEVLTTIPDVVIPPAD